jgi:hypothetical protein
VKLGYLSITVCPCFVKILSSFGNITNLNEFLEIIGFCSKFYYKSSGDK